MTAGSWFRRSARTSLLAHAVLATALAAQAVEPSPVPAGRVPGAGAYAPGFDALHYDIAITLPADGQRIEGRARIDIALLSPRRDTLVLDLSGLRVVAATIAVGRASPQAAVVAQADGRMRLAVPPGARIGDTLHVDIRYDGEPDDGLIIRANVHGDRSVFADNWPDRARFWFPSIDHPGDKATVAFEVRAPANWEVITNGTIAGGVLPARPADGVWRSRVDIPIPTYTMVIGATDFAIGTVARCASAGTTATRTGDCVPVTYWAYPQDSARAAGIFRRAGAMVEYYADRFGPFPYAGLAHVQSATRFGGMENVGAIFYSEQAIASGNLGETTVAHETAHQWFGDAVTPATWNHIWLSEGFATYFGMQFFEHADGLQAFRQQLTASAEGYLASDDIDIPIVDSTAVPGNNLFQLLNTNSYNKGGQVLHMLRGIVGDDAFFAGIRRYTDAHIHRNAVTADLRRALEAASGQDLGWFFEQWVFRPGYPIYSLSHTWDATTKQAVVTVEQTQKAEWPVFRMPVEFAFDTPTGEIRRRADVAQRSTTLRFDLPAAPTAIRIDPDGWILKRLRD